MVTHIGDNKRTMLLTQSGVVGLHMGIYVIDAVGRLLTQKQMNIAQN